MTATEHEWFGERAPEILVLWYQLKSWTLIPEVSKAQQRLIGREPQYQALDPQR
jgi:hypothetical protein